MDQVNLKKKITAEKKIDIPNLFLVELCPPQIPMLKS